MRSRAFIYAMLGAWLVLSGHGHAGTITLQWNASQGAQSYRLYYGTIDGPPYQTMLETGPSTTASVGGLTDGTRYYFAATASNRVGESVYSNEVSAMPSPEPSQDTIPPVVHLSSPADGATVPRRSTETIVVEATDNVGVVSVGVSVNADQLWCTGAGPYACTWRVPAPPRRRYTLQAFAMDAAQNQGVSHIVEVTAE
jgi:hypothetical protein